MRIVHALNDIEDNGNGIVNVAVDLACAQSGAGHDVHVLSSPGEFEHLLALSGVKHHIIDHDRSVRNCPRLLVAYWRVLSEIRPDVLHAHMLTSTVVGKLLKTALRYLLVTTVHNEWQRGVWLMGAGDRVVAVSSAVERAMKRRGVRQAKLYTVANGTLGTLRRPTVSEIEPASLKKPAIVAVGSVCERKGSDLLLEAFESVLNRGLNAHLYFVGNMDWPELEEVARSSPASERVTFVGYSRLPQSFCKAADIFVMASRKDPMPLVLSEAREVGLPIIGSDAGGIPEALDYGAAGLIFRVGSTLGLEGHLRRLLESESERRIWASRSATGTERFSVDRVCRDYLEVYSVVR